MTKHPVQVRFVGSGDAFGSGGRFQACVLLHAPAQGDQLAPAHAGQGGHQDQSPVAELDRVGQSVELLA